MNMAPACARLGATVLLALTPLRAQNVHAPDPIAVYYGWPSLVNGATSNAQAAQTFAAYTRVVLGDGLQDPTHPDHANTAAIVALAPATRFYGYITLGNAGGAGHSRATIQTRIAQWRALGARGIFLDEAGYEYQVSRQRQLDALADVHAAGADAWVNAWVPADLFGADVTPQNPTGLPSGMTAQDRYLLESFQILNGGYEDPAEFVLRADAASAYGAQFGTAIDAVTTTLAGQPFDQGKLDYAWWSTALYGFAGFGWGEPIFAALTLQMPYRARPNAVPGGTWIGGVVHAPTLPLQQRIATTGHLRVDTSAHTGSFVPIALTGPAVAPLGVASGYALAAATSPGLPYLTAITDRTTPGLVWLDGRTLPIDTGSLFAVPTGANPVFQGFAGNLDGAGGATPVLTPPNLPGLAGLRLWFVSAVLDLTTPEVIRVFSQPLGVQLQ